MGKMGKKMDSHVGIIRVKLELFGYPQSLGGDARAHGLGFRV